ncbi:MAG: phosphatase PAP2 family protein [Phycicoccus sp.]
MGRVLSPFPVLIALICWVAAATSPDLTSAIRWAALAAGLIAGVPFVALLLLRASGRVTDRQVAHRSQRHVLLAIALLSTAVATAALWMLDASPPLRTLVTVMFVLLAVMAALTPWKPSLHAAVATGAVMALSQLHGPAALVLLCLLPVIAWARIRSGRHTPAQVATGALLGSAVPLLTLAVLP